MAHVRGRANDTSGVPRATTVFQHVSCRRAADARLRADRAHAHPLQAARARAFRARACLALCGRRLRGLSGPRPRAVRHAR
eukprot:6967368-Prymnesium_polylepis.1